ncbi:acetyltransferase [Mariprofundus ferrooxydans]|uniref:acetyltransferase n=1 Tax=Mariprofundus ferrooxydans TaxID=314344 RepID=UPI001430EEDC|nr:acetyltransferase [Mariprofundus ferrooxydans]
MNQLLILGAGGHGKVMAEAAEAQGAWQHIALLDDRHALLDGTLRWPVLASIERAGHFVSEYSHAAVAVGDSKRRLEWLDMLAGLGFCIPTLIHPAAWVSPSASLAEGCVVMANATVQADARLGRGSIVNTGASVDHDCSIGDGVHICPGASLGGEVIIGHGSWLGIGCSVIQGVRIGSHVTVGAGAAVISDIGDAMTVVGVPARGISRGME